VKFAFILAAILFAQAQPADVTRIRAMLDSGRMEQAESAARALLQEIDARNNSADSPELASTLEILVESFDRSARSKDPVERGIAGRALAVTARLFPPDHRLRIDTRRAVAQLWMKDEDFHGARAILEELVAILDGARRLPPGYDTPEDLLAARAGAWNDLGQVLRRVGEHAGAVNAYERALGIFRERGVEDREVAIANNNLAGIRAALGQTEGALQQYRTAMRIYEKTEGPDSPLVAGCLNNMGQALLLLGRPAEAEPLLRRSLAIATATYGPGNVRTGHAAGNLGNALYDKGDFAAGIEMWEHARRSYESSYGAHHTYYATALAGIANGLFREGRTREALQTGLEAARISREYLDLTVRGVPEREALLRSAARASGADWSQKIDAIFTYVQSDPGPAMRRAVLDAEIRNRGVVFDELAARARGASTGARDPRIGSRAEMLAAARERLSQLVVKGRAGSSAADFAARLEQARRDKAEAEMALAEASAGFRGEWRRSRLGIDEVSAALLPGDALVSYVQFRRRSGRISQAVPSYLAMVLRAGEFAPEIFPLGDAASLDALVAAVRKQVLDEAESAGRAPKLSEAAYRTAAERLRRAVWDPVSKSLAGVKRVFIVADGQLNLVSFAALPVGDSRYLIERGPLLHYLSSERDLVREAKPAAGQGLLAVAASPPGLARPGPLRGSPPGCLDFQSLHFDPLPGSAAEVSAIADTWARGGAGPVTRLTAGPAGKSSFERMAAGRRVLHLAVHGFYLGGCEESAAGNPLLLSGLAFSSGRAGILTGEEIMALDLSGVEWAVLSGCDTGVGDVQTGEGVFGLRSAFALAGVRTLILSLWPVDDSATREWMTALYRARLLRHLDTAESSRQAALSVLESRRKGALSSHPFYWAGFVAAGDWR
jgi:CHAT domain-containing protein